MNDNDDTKNGKTIILASDGEPINAIKEPVRVRYPGLPQLNVPEAEAQINMALMQVLQVFLQFHPLSAMVIAAHAARVLQQSINYPTVRQKVEGDALFQAALDAAQANGSTLENPAIHLSGNVILTPNG